MTSRTLILIAASVLLAVPARGARRLRAQSLYDQARGAQGRGQLDSAYDLARRATEAEPDRGDAWALLGECSCSKAGRAGVFSAYGLARRCRAAFARAVALAPDSVPYLQGLAQYLAGAPGIVGGDRDSALALARHVLRLDEGRGAFVMASVLWPGDARAKVRADSFVAAAGEQRAGDLVFQMRVAEWWAATGRPERALATYERQAARDLRDPVARFFVGRQLVLMQREPRQAQDHLRFAAAATVPAPGPGVATFTPGAPWWRLGQSYEQLGMADSARLCFEQALRVNPQLDVAKASLDSLERR